MALVMVKVPDDVLEEIKADAEKRAQEMMHEQLIEFANEFIDVTDLSQPSGVRLLRHALTGRTLRITAEWIDAER